ncbi:MAG TPA: RDD family protein [Gammaproteobacteria bacterium]|nr:RDD family protein [Gammaproteobacteria bacterium]
MLDTTARCETPEGVDLQLRLAGPFVRAQAWVYDLMLRVLGYLGAVGLLAYLGAFGMGLAAVLVFLVEWLYPFYFELARGGATPGKKAKGIYVLQDNGAPLEWRAALLRNLLRAVDFAPVLYGLGLTVMAFSPRFQRLGDVAAGTLVVYRAREPAAPAAPAGPAKAPPVALDLAEQQALLAFAERAPELSPGRQAELAELLDPLLPDQGGDGATRLQEYARWYQGAGLTGGGEGQ